MTDTPRSPEGFREALARVKADDNPIMVWREGQGFTPVEKPVDEAVDEIPYSQRLLRAVLEDEERHWAETGKREPYTRIIVTPGQRDRILDDSRPTDWQRLPNGHEAWRGMLLVVVPERDVFDARRLL